MTFFNNLTGTLATNIGKGVLQGLKQSVKDLSGGSNALNNFASLMNSDASKVNNSETVNLSDLDITPGELSNILKLRETALAQGSEEVMFNFRNQKYQMNIESFDMKLV
jgi:hypothetical protein